MKVGRRGGGTKEEEEEEEEEEKEGEEEEKEEEEKEEEEKEEEEKEEEVEEGGETDACSCVPSCLTMASSHSSCACIPSAVPWMMWGAGSRRSKLAYIHTNTQNRIAPYSHDGRSHMTRI